MHQLNRRRVWLKSDKWTLANVQCNTLPESDNTHPEDNNYIMNGDSFLYIIPWETGDKLSRFKKTNQCNITIIEYSTNLLVLICGQSKLWFAIKVLCNQIRTTAFESIITFNTSPEMISTGRLCRYSRIKWKTNRFMVKSIMRFTIRCDYYLLVILQLLLIFMVNEFHRTNAWSNC